MEKTICIASLEQVGKTSLTNNLELFGITPVTKLRVMDTIFGIEVINLELHLNPRANELQMKM